MISVYIALSLITTLGAIGSILSISEFVRRKDLVLCTIYTFFLLSNSIGIYFFSYEIIKACYS